MRAEWYADREEAKAVAPDRATECRVPKPRSE